MKCSHYFSVFFQRTLTTTEPSDASLPGLRSLASALKELIALWFSVGFLQLERVTWQSPCAMLEKVGTRTVTVNEDTVTVNVHTKSQFWNALPW